MATRTELERLAAMGAALRPDWPYRSILTYLLCDHAQRPYRDLAVAFAYIATDPLTQTPKRLSEPGPWWTTTITGTNTMPGKERCEEHPWEKAWNCRACRSEQLEATDTDRRLVEQGVPRDQVRRILAEHGITPDAKQRAGGDLA